MSLPVKLASLFSDQMVLQRDHPAPVWGRGLPGDEIAVEFAGQTKSAVAGPDGKWIVSLDPMPASREGRVLTAESVGRQKKIEVKDVLVGDVWLCSGQSNMEWPVSLAANNAEEIAAADHPRIRLFTVPRLALSGPRSDVEADWKICTPESIASFSAVGYYFGREVQRATDVPIGLINSSWGGTRIEAWTSLAALDTDAGCCRELEAIEAWRQSPAGRKAMEEYQSVGFSQEAWEHRQGSPDPGNIGFSEGWAGLDLDDEAWPQMILPNQWQSAGHKYTGVFWFRRTVDVPIAWAGRDLELHLGACDKTDTTYFNNVGIGATGFEITNSWCTPRVYRIPGSAVKTGRNVVVP